MISGGEAGGWCQIGDISVWQCCFFFRGGTENWLPSSAVMVSSWQMLRGGRSPTVVMVLISRKRLKYIHLIVQLESPGLKFCYCVVEYLFRTCGNTEWRFTLVVLFLLITYSMVQSPSSEANLFAASQEIPRISRNPKAHYRTHKRPPPVSILGQPNPGNIPTSYLLEIHPNIIHPSTPRPPQWSLSLRFPHQDPIHPPLLTHTH